MKMSDKIQRVYKSLSAGGLTIKQLETRTGYPSATVRSYLVALEKEGHVEREIVDGRQKIWKMKNANNK